MNKMHLVQYSVVRIIKLVQPTSDYDGWCVNKRSPQVGDSGTLIDILQADGLPDKFLVEFSDNDGVTICLADFFIEEFEVVIEGNK